MPYENSHQSYLLPAVGEDDTLKVTVVYTSDQATLSAMQSAATLAGSLHANLTLVYPQVVPYPRPLNSPPVLPAFTEKRLRAIASQIPMDTDIHVCLCRDREDALATELRPRSVVVLGGRKRWWPTAEKSLARKLLRAGHEVIFTETE
ncbi:MAG TPA: hypothetical protein VG096_02990 [Bryobacteraceae bacterium]|jgi:hypothetical protein|nr:hypothetical protein [Bryobacteraceae bacterium]